MVSVLPTLLPCTGSCHLTSWNPGIIAGPLRRGQLGMNSDSLVLSEMGWSWGGSLRLSSAPASFRQNYGNCRFKKHGKCSKRPICLLFSLPLLSPTATPSTTCPSQSHSRVFPSPLRPLIIPPVCWGLVLLSPVAGTVIAPFSRRLGRGGLEGHGKNLDSGIW